MGIINNDSIEKVFSIIMQDENLQKELTKKKTIDEVYEFCTSISEGYTIEELKDFLSKAEEQLTKVSGGIKLNNKALSTVLATMAIASPLAGAAGQTQNQPQPSKISGFVKSIKEKILKHPAEASITVGGLTLAAIKLFGNSSGRKNNGGSTDAPNIQNNNTTPPPVDPPPVDPPPVDPPAVVRPQNQMPPYLAGISPQINRLNKIVGTFTRLSGCVNSYTPDLLARKCKDFFTARSVLSIQVAKSHVVPVKDILFAIDNNINLNNVYDVGFDNRMFRGTNADGVQLYSKNDISNSQILQVDTTDITSLENIVIYYKTSAFSGRFLFRDNTQNPNKDFTNEEKAIIIRYIQASYLKDKGILDD